MKILFLTSAHNSLSQLLLVELTACGHDIHVCVAATGEAMIAAVSDEVPDLIIAPMLKIAIPEQVWSRYVCLIVHPGIKGDRGPSSLDWAIANHEKTWGVTILQAATLPLCPFAPDPGRRALGRSRFLVQWHRSQYHRGECRSGCGILTEH
jgi:putative two-component system protein, hydrogenase maturation factor HypX/HoxX